MLIPGICTQCGATLSVDKEKDAMVCPYCGTAFIVEKAIQQYSIVNNINAQNVYIQGNIEKDFEIIGGVLVKYRGEAEAVKIPDGVKKIGDAVFEGTGICSVEMPDSVVEIGGRAFMQCTCLEKIVWSTNLKHIGVQAFAGCSSLTELHLPNDVVEIKAEAFYWCNNVKEVVLPTNLEQIGNKAFFGCAGIAEVRIPESKKGLSWSSAYSGCGIKKVDISSKFLKEHFRFECNWDTEVYIDGQKLQRGDERVKYFPGTRDAFEWTQSEWRRLGYCQHCGGYEWRREGGMFARKYRCPRCKKLKDY